MLRNILYNWLKEWNDTIYRPHSTDTQSMFWSATRITRSSDPPYSDLRIHISNEQVFFSLWSSKSFKVEKWKAVDGSWNVNLSRFWLLFVEWSDRYMPRWDLILELRSCSSGWDILEMMFGPKSPGQASLLNSQIGISRLKNMTNTNIDLLFSVLFYLSLF